MWYSVEGCGKMRRSEGNGGGEGFVGYILRRTEMGREKGGLDE